MWSRSTRRQRKSADAEDAFLAITGSAWDRNQLSNYPHGSLARRLALSGIEKTVPHSNMSDIKISARERRPIRIHSLCPLVRDIMTASLATLEQIQ